MIHLQFNGKITVPVMAKQPVFPTPFTGHPSYAYPKVNINLYN